MGVFPNLGNEEVAFTLLGPSFTDPEKKHTEIEVMKAQEKQMDSDLWI